MRVRASRDQTHRFATTGPFYVEFEKPRISRAATDFFSQWVTDQAAELAREDPESWKRLQPYYDRAVDFWSKKAQAATVD